MGVPSRRGDRVDWFVWIGDVGLLGRRSVRGLANESARELALMRFNHRVIGVRPLRALTAHTHPGGHSLKCWPNMLLKIHAQQLALRIAVQFCLRHVGQRPSANICGKFAIENAAASTVRPPGRR